MGGTGIAAGWMVLAETTEALSGTHSVEEVVAVLRDSARRISGADGVTFVRREGDQCHYVEENAIAPLWKGRRFPLTACISGWCMLNRQVAVIPDIYADPRIPHDAYRPTFVKSLVMVPVRAEDPLAAIGSYWAHHHEPSPEDVAMLEALARATATAIANAELYAQLRDAAEEARRHAGLLAGMVEELNHRVKNSLATVQSIAVQSLRHAATPRDFQDGFLARLHALSLVHNLLNQSAWGCVALAELAQAVLAPFGPAARVEAQGPLPRVSPAEAVTLGLMIQELATNAARHGALATAGGTVRLRLVSEAADPSLVRLSWRERGGPAVARPSRTGFGTRLIERSAASLGGRAELSFLPEGFECRMQLRMPEPRGPAGTTPAPPS